MYCSLSHQPSCESSAVPLDTHVLGVWCIARSRSGRQWRNSTSREHTELTRQHPIRSSRPYFYSSSSIIMVRRRGKQAPASGSRDGDAVLSLELDSRSRSMEPREVDARSPDEVFKVPCTLKGLSAASSGGGLGFVFGWGARAIELVLECCGRIVDLLCDVCSQTGDPSSTLIECTSIMHSSGGYWMSKRLQGSFRESLKEGWTSGKVCGSKRWARGRADGE